VQGMRDVAPRPGRVAGVARRRPPHGAAGDGADRAVPRADRARGARERSSTCSGRLRAHRGRQGPAGRVVLGKHALRNALLPVVTVIGAQVGFMFSGAVLTETVFAWPGLGRLLLPRCSRATSPSSAAMFLLLTVAWCSRRCSSTCSTRRSTRGSAMPEREPRRARAPAAGASGARCSLWRRALAFCSWRCSRRCSRRATRSRPPGAVPAASPRPTRSAPTTSAATCCAPWCTARACRCSSASAVAGASLRWACWSAAWRATPAAPSTTCSCASPSWCWCCRASSWRWWWSRCSAPTCATWSPCWRSRVGASSRAWRAPACWRSRSASTCWPPARSGGAAAAILWRHVLPNVLAPVVAYAALQVGNAILVEASLSFLGFGDPNLVSWGYLLNNAQAFVRRAWWLSRSRARRSSWRCSASTCWPTGCGVGRAANGG
jgi:hypothetical protein